MSTSIKITGGNKFMAVLNKLATQGGVELKVGVLEGATDSNGEPIALRAFYNEYGTVNIPARPAFRNTVAAQSSNWAKGLATTVRGRTTESGVIENAFKQLGQVMQEDIQDTIGSGVGDPLAVDTILRRALRQGREAENALQLVDYGDYQESINYEVNKK